MDEYTSRRRTRTALSAFLILLTVYVAMSYTRNSSEAPREPIRSSSSTEEPIVLGIPPTIPFEPQATFTQVLVPGLLPTPVPSPTMPLMPASAQAAPPQLSSTLALTIIPPRSAFAVNERTYTVEAGDTLFRIALRFGISAESLAQANALSDPSLIVVGQVLRIPSSLLPSATPVSAYFLFAV